MKRVVICMTLIFVLATFLYSEYAKKHTPRISFESINHDFGRVRKGAELIHVFRFSNTGTGTLEIQKVLAS